MSESSQPVATAPPGPAEDRARAIDCLALAIAYEAGNESNEGQEAVAEVVLNRVRTPTFPKSVCDVVFAGSSRRSGCQFSFTCDGSLNRRLPARMTALARIVAERAMDGFAPSHVSGATHYHANYVMPYWAPTLTRIVTIGAHIFYRGATGAGVTVAVTGPSALAAERPPILQSATPGADQSPTAPAIRALFAPWGLVASGR